MTVEDIRKEREEAEREAFFIAAPLPLVGYCADGNDVKREDTRETVHTANSHWGACLVMLAAGRRDVKDHADAYGYTGWLSDCHCCNASGIDYGETCVTCGGYGWIRH